MIDVGVILSGRNIFNSLLIYHRTFKVILVDGMSAYVIGDSDMITGFRLVGVDGFEADTASEAMQILIKILARKDIGIIIISQAYLSNPEMQEQLDKIRQERVSPIIVEIPASKGPSKQVQLSETISKILGMKI
jgi:vacuolar-type H+-ATPase subunit F/Vma7